MNDIYKLLPRNKYDFKRVNRLKKIERSQLIQLLPNPLEWLQDINWPIAPEITNLLLEFPNELVPHIKKVITGDDDIWKNWCLIYLVAKFPFDFKIIFKAELEKLANFPTPDEKFEELDDLAREILSTLER